MIEYEILPAKSDDLDQINDLITEHNTGGNQSYQPSQFISEDLIEGDKSVILLGGYL